LEEINELIQERIKKLERLKDIGIDPYGGPFEVKDRVSEIVKRCGTANKEELEEKDEKCTIAGRIVSFRGFGKASFAHIQDATGKIQVYFKKDVLGKNYDTLKHIDIGDIVGVRGLSDPFRKNGTD
jgi:lysyl-tRNA synthetase class 2